MGKVTGTAERRQGLLLAVTLAVILGAVAWRGAVHWLPAVRTREFTAALDDAAAAGLAAVAAGIALLTARATARHRGLHHESPGPDVPADRNIPAGRENVPRPVRVPSRSGQPAYSYTLRPPADAGGLPGRRP
jgi:hypothetical protein